MGKNIVVFSDGTGQEGGEGRNSNVYRLFNMVRDRSADQIAFYDEGLGTGRRKLIGLATGYGISKNILDCYRFIFENFETTDKIYLFGFSRGATTVRSLSGFIHMFGILPKSRPELIEKAYNIYKISDDNERKTKADAFIKRHHTMWTRIRFIGVWDTVAALGVPIKSMSVMLNKVPRFRHKYHNFELSTSVENAYHALSIDDERKTFHPVLWDKTVAPDQVMRQVWFCGVHTDVGGGYEACGLSDITLDWMVAGAGSVGLKIHGGHKIMTNPDHDGIMHDSRGGKLASLYRRKVRAWNPAMNGSLDVHVSVQNRALNQKNEAAPPYKPWILDPGYDGCRRYVP